MSVTGLIAWLLIAAIPMSAAAGSARMELPVAPGLIAEADYWPGEADRAAVLILHGFLQTREFPTVRRLAESLAEQGFSVLTPTLTLGLNRRRQSLACEAVHTHSLQQDVAELRAWTRWLAERSGKPPVLIGHSVGGVQLAAMLDSGRDLAIERALLVSLTYFGEEQGEEQTAALVSRARAEVAGEDSRISPYALSYCEQYVTTAADFLSYASWDRERVGRALVSLSRPVAVIFGERDARIDRAWLDTLRDSGLTVRAVAGANHFFDLTHEFDLLDEVERLIAGGEHG